MRIFRKPLDEADISKGGDHETRLWLGLLSFPAPPPKCASPVGRDMGQRQGLGMGLGPSITPEGNGSGAGMRAFPGAGWLASSKPELWGVVQSPPGDRGHGGRGGQSKCGRRLWGERWRRGRRGWGQTGSAGRAQGTECRATGGAEEEQRRRTARRGGKRGRGAGPRPQRGGAVLWPFGRCRCLFGATGFRGSNGWNGGV